MPRKNKLQQAIDELQADKRELYREQQRIEIRLRDMDSLLHKLIMINDRKEVEKVEKAS